VVNIYTRNFSSSVQKIVYINKTYLSFFLFDFKK
jgi:hypothetical protein